jgi:hypothetical protein
MIRPIAIIATLGLAACAAQQPQSSGTGDVTDTELNAVILGPEPQCASVFREADDPVEVCRCLRLAVQEAQRTGGFNSAQFNDAVACLKHTAALHYLTPQHAP